MGWAMRSFFLLTLLTSVVSSAEAAESQNGLTDEQYKMQLERCTAEEKDKEEFRKAYGADTLNSCIFPSSSNTQKDTCEKLEDRFQSKMQDVERKCSEAGFSGNIKGCKDEAVKCAKEKRNNTNGLIDAMSTVLGSSGAAAMTPNQSVSKCANYTLDTWERTKQRIESDRERVTEKSRNLQSELDRALSDFNRTKEQVASSNLKDNKSDADAKNELKDKEKEAIEKAEKLIASDFNVD